MITGLLHTSSDAYDIKIRFSVDLEITPSMFTAVDQTKAMQEQMSGAGMMTPPDPMKAFKAEWEALEVCNHQWVLNGVEEDLIDGPVQPETIYIKNKYA